MPRAILSPIDLIEEPAPGTPNAGLIRFYGKTDHKLYIKDSTGAESALGGGSVSAITHIEADITALLGGTPAHSGRFVVTDAAMTVGKRVIMYQSGLPITGKGTRSDENEMDGITCSVSVATGGGSATVYWKCPTFVHGVFGFDYIIG